MLSRRPCQRPQAVPLRLRHIHATRRVLPFICRLAAAR